MHSHFVFMGSVSLVCVPLGDEWWIRFIFFIRNPVQCLVESPSIAVAVTLTQSRENYR